MRWRQLLVFTLLVLIPACNSRQSAKSRDIIVFHAGSLSVPFSMLKDQYERQNPGVNILLESAGSLVCARKITELKKPCDIMASADYFVIDQLLIPDHTKWSIRFATNEIVIAYTDRSKYSDSIDSISWTKILMRDDVIFGRSDPDKDPCGYRTVMSLMLAEKYYSMPGLAGRFTAKNRDFIRPKEVDLIALMESNAIDYMFQYKSVAVQHRLRFIELPDEINLGNPELNHIYGTVSVEIIGSKPGEKMTVRGEYINYSLTILEDAPSPAEAKSFVSFLLGSEGMKIFRRAGQEPILPFSTDQAELIPYEFKKYLK